MGPLARARWVIAFLTLCRKVHGQNQLPISSVDGQASASTTTTTTEASSTALPTTVSLPPTYPTGSATFSPHPSPTYDPSALKQVLYAVTPVSPLPVSDPLNGPWLLPDYTAAWDAALAKARTFITPLTLEEKVNLTTGVGWMNGPCVGNIPGLSAARIAELAELAELDVNINNNPDAPHSFFHGICLQDAPTGVRYAQGVTAFPAALTVAQTWSRRLCRQRGEAMGAEFRAMGVHVALAPMANIGRVPEGGRNWEGFGADPWLSGECAYESVLGIQKMGVQATAKHYINNEQEHARTWSSSIVDDRTQHEVYAHPFLRMVMAGAASVMCSYNMINSTYACENPALLNGLLKTEMGFRGYVQSDWQATMSTLAAAEGLDMSMPGDRTFNSGDSFFGANLTAYVQNGTIASARLDDMAARVMAGMFLLEQDKPGFPGVGFDSWDMYDPIKNNATDVRADHHKLVRQIAAQGTVLLKNENGTLPLKHPQSIALIGSDAGPPKRGPNGYADRGGYDGVLAVGWGSGTTRFPYLISPLEGIQVRARAHNDRTLVDWSFDDFDLPAATAVARGAEVALVFVSADSGEEYISVDGNEGDRRNLTVWKGGDELVKAVAGVNSHVVVVIHAVGPVLVEEWIDHPNVTAVLFAGLPGQEAGSSIADVLYGEGDSHGPAGKLPFTIARAAEDYNAPIVRGGVQGQDVLAVDYAEGLEVDYRGFDARNITPRFEFGFGLSYTTFEYTDLEVFRLTQEPDSPWTVQEDAWTTGAVVPVHGTESSTAGGSAAAWLHAPAYSVRFTLANTGERAGTEIAQVYVAFPSGSGEPPRVLRGFTDVRLEKGRSETVVITLSRYALSVWDVQAQGWKRPEDTIGVWVGESSRKLVLEGLIPE